MIILKDQYYNSTINTLGPKKTKKNTTTTTISNAKKNMIYLGANVCAVNWKAQETTCNINDYNNLQELKTKDSIYKKKNLIFFTEICT